MTTTPPPSDLQRLIWRVWHLQDQWSLWESLYGEGGTSRVETLNVAAGHVFGHMQAALWDNVQLEIGRLLDPPTTGKGKVAQKNLVLESVITDLPSPQKDKEKARLLKRLRAMRKASARILKHRHKRLAHIDHAVACQVHKIDGVKRIEMTKAVGRIFAILRDTAEALGENIGPWDQKQWQVDKLCKILTYGVERWKAERGQRLASVKTG